MTRFPSRTGLVALALIAAACTSSSSPNTTASTNVPETTTIAVRPSEPGQSDVVAIAVENWVADHEVVGAVVLVLAGDGSRQLLTSGWADRESQRPSSADDHFRIGSITKLYTAALTLSLVEDGILSLDGLASEYVAGIADGVTVADLLAHTSGLRDLDVAEGIFDAVENGGTIDPARDPLGEALEQDLAFQPGTRQSYSSIGYLALERLIEAATGETFADLLDDRILSPQKLESTELESSASVLPTPYERLGPGSPAISLSQFPLAGLARGTGAAGALVATADDVAGFVRALFNDTIITDRSLAMMMDTTAPRRDYGLGFSVYRAGSEVLYGHNGRTIGFASSVRHDPVTNITVVVLANDGSAPTEELADHLALAAIEASPGR